MSGSGGEELSQLVQEPVLVPVTIRSSFAECISPADDSAADAVSANFTVAEPGNRSFGHCGSTAVRMVHPQSVGRPR